MSVLPLSRSHAPVLTRLKGPIPVRSICATKCLKAANDSSKGPPHQPYSVTFLRELTRTLVSLSFFVWPIEELVFPLRWLPRLVNLSNRLQYRSSDNLFIEQVWCTMKHHEVYLKSYRDGNEARAALTGCFWSYNNQRPHRSLGYRIPAPVYHSVCREQPAASLKAPIDLRKTAGLHLIPAPVLC